MKTCNWCQNYKGVCIRNNKEPPASYAEKCRYFLQGDKPFEEEIPEETRACSACEMHDNGWCLRLDEPDWKYNFIRIKEETKCPKQ